VYLKSTDNRPDDHCWCCDPENNNGTHQTRDHLFKQCYKWEDQQAAVWTRVRRYRRRASRSGAWADERCSPAVLDFLRSTYVGIAAPPVEQNWDSEDEVEEETEVAEVEEQAEL